MRPGDAWLAAEMVLRGLVRRRLPLALLVLLPLALYVARHDLVGQSVRFLTLGVAWAASTVAFFAAVAAREAERRLCLNGWTWSVLVLGRICALLGLGLTLSSGYFLLVVTSQNARNDAGVALDLVSTTVVAVLVGSFLGALVQRELEGALLLFTVAGLQFMTDPPSLLAQALPFWSTRELATYAIDGPDHGDLTKGLLHAAVTGVLLLGGTAWLSRARLKVRPPVAPAHLV